MSTKKKSGILNQARNWARIMGRKPALSPRNIRRLVKRLPYETVDANKYLIKSALAKARGETN